MRLDGYDYSQAGAYFVTLNVKGHQSRMGYVRDGDMRLSPLGKIVDSCWTMITNRYVEIELDAFVVMPNHLHGIINLYDVRRGEAFEAGLSSVESN
jgi:REP element-mobilizing transposase RayT